MADILTRARDFLNENAGCIDGTEERSIIADMCEALEWSRDNTQTAIDNAVLGYRQALEFDAGLRIQLEKDLAASKMAHVQALEHGVELADKLLACGKERDAARTEVETVRANGHELRDSLLAVLKDEIERTRADVGKIVNDRIAAETERDEALDLLRDANRWIEDACEYIAAAAPDGDSWDRDGGLADRSDDLVARISVASGGKR